jgi:hypothetical protein
MNQGGSQWFMGVSSGYLVREEQDLIFLTVQSALRQKEDRSFLTVQLVIPGYVRARQPFDPRRQCRRKCPSVQ